MTNCIFCKIIEGEIPCSKVLENDHFVVFQDVNPVAPVHVLVVPKMHFSNLNELFMKEPELSGKILSIINETASKLGVIESGYRLIMNSGENGGQTVGHLHFHLIGGTKLNNKLV